MVIDKSLLVRDFFYMPNLPIQILAATTDILILLFVVYYLWRLHVKEKELEKMRAKIDTDYHRIVDDALAKERKILDDATKEADQIIAGAQYIHKASEERVEQTLRKLSEDIQKGTIATAHNYMTSYTHSLQQLTASSLANFQQVAKVLESDLQKQAKGFHDTALPALEKELESYKQARLKDAEQKITKIVQKASQEIFNKSVSLEDHHVLMLEALEKAKKEGVFS